MILIPYPSDLESDLNVQDYYLMRVEQLSKAVVKERKLKTTRAAEANHIRPGSQTNIGFGRNFAGYAVYPNNKEGITDYVAQYIDCSTAESGKRGPQYHPDQTCLLQVVEQLVEQGIFKLEKDKEESETFDPEYYKKQFEELPKKGYTMLFYSER